MAIKGLKGFESLDEQMDAKAPFANLHARDLLDNSFWELNNAATRITFKDGTISAQTGGTFTRYHQKVEFVVRAEKGQRMIVNIIGVTSGLATAGVVTDPAGKGDGQPGGIVFNDIVAATGDHKIEVSQRPTEFNLPAHFIVEVILLPDYLDLKE